MVPLVFTALKKKTCADQSPSLSFMFQFRVESSKEVMKAGLLVHFNLRALLQTTKETVIQHNTQLKVKGPPVLM